MNIIAELYLVCMGCKRIPEWTSVEEEVKDGKMVKKYKFDSPACPYCGGEKFELVQVRSGTECRQSFVPDATNVEGLQPKT